MKLPALIHCLSRFTLVLILLFLMSGCTIPDRYLFTANNKIAPSADYSGLSKEDVVFLSTDHLRLHGWYIVGDADKPLVLFFQGTATNLTFQTENLELLRKLGVSIFIFDYRGYGASEGTPSEKGTYRDARGALNYLKKRGWDPARMIYFGRSLGSAIAIQLALEAPPCGLILESPFTSIIDMICHHRPIACPIFTLAFHDHYDSFSKIGRIATPLLVFQGDKDSVVPINMVRSLFAKSPPPKEFHAISGAGHANIYQVGGATYWQYWRQFIERTSSGAWESPESVSLSASKSPPAGPPE